ncbi:MAG: nucleotidyltransferase [Firmicutes bacterium]|nr:nucleotidyltransferase [Bacillota bacterium]
MNIVGLITEYNPFHNGHLHHFKLSKEVTNSSFSVCVMSGNFLQRGEPAIVDKWTRAKSAVDSGVDLVLELPTIYACQSAEYFSYGAIKLLDSLNIINSISFGSESGNLHLLKEIANVLSYETLDFKNHLKKSLSNGDPFPKARNYALKKSLDKDVSEILLKSNNILAIEYLKALNKLKSNIKPFTIKRKGADYNSNVLTGNISSATSIRKSLLENYDLNDIAKSVPSHSYRHLANFYNKYKTFNKLENYNEILLYLLRTSNKEMLNNLIDVEEGLNNRIKSVSNKHDDIRVILNNIKTKRYAYTRLQRILIHLLLDLTEDKFDTYHNSSLTYVRVLASNVNGFKILKEIKRNSNVDIITKFANYEKIKSKEIKEMIEIDKKATDIYFLGLNTSKTIKANYDYYISPYIKKD